MESELTTEEIANLFRAADEDGSGFLSPDEISSIMTQLNGGVAPSEADVVACLRIMDTNQDGQISEEEFLEAMLTWLGMVKFPRSTSGKRPNDSDASPAFSRKKTLNDMANFFRQFSTVPNFAAEQNRILTSRRKEVDMTAVHREYALPSPEERAAAYEGIKSILSEGKAPIMQAIHSLDWGVVLEGIEKVKCLLSVVEMFPSEEDRYDMTCHTQPPPPRYIYTLIYAQISVRFYDISDLRGPHRGWGRVRDTSCLCTYTRDYCLYESFI